MSKGSDEMIKDVSSTFGTYNHNAFFEHFLKLIEFEITYIVFIKWPNVYGILGLINHRLQILILTIKDQNIEWYWTKIMTLRPD